MARSDTIRSLLLQVITAQAAARAAVRKKMQQQPKKASEPRVRVELHPPGEEPSAWCDGAGDIGSPRAVLDRAEDSFARLSLKERRRHLEALRQSLDEDDVVITAASGEQPVVSKSMLRQAPSPTRSHRQVWAESPYGAAEQLLWRHPDYNPDEPGPHDLRNQSGISEPTVRGMGQSSILSSPASDFSSRYEPEPSPEPSPQLPVHYNPWGLASAPPEGESEPTATHLADDVKDSCAGNHEWAPAYANRERIATPASDHVVATSCDEHPESLGDTAGDNAEDQTAGAGEVRESVLLADAMEVYGEDNLYTMSRLSSPAEHERSLDELHGDGSEDELLYLSHSPDPESLGPESPLGSSGGPGWLSRPPAVAVSPPRDLGTTLGSTLGGTLFKPSDSLSPSSLSQHGFTSYERPYEPGAYSAEKEQQCATRDSPKLQESGGSDEAWGSSNIYDDCLNSSEHPEAPQSDTLLAEEVNDQL